MSVRYNLAARAFQLEIYIFNTLLSRKFDERKHTVFSNVALGDNDSPIPMSTIRSSSSMSSVLSFHQSRKISPSSATEKMLSCVDQFWNNEKAYADVTAFCERTIRQLRLSYDPNLNEKTEDQLRETLTQ